MFSFEYFWKMQFSEIDGAFIWHPNPLKLSLIINNILNFIKFIKKIQENKMSNKFEFSTIIDTFGTFKMNPLATFIV